MKKSKIIMGLSALLVISLIATGCGKEIPVKNGSKVAVSADETKITATEYYNEIKKELIDNEVNKKVKDYSKNKYEIQKYYNVGKLLLEAGNNYGERIIKEYSKKLTNEIGKNYSVRYLFDIRKLYLFLKVHPVGAQLTLTMFLHL